MNAKRKEEKEMKKVFILAMSIILLFSAMAMPISAAQVNDEIAQPYWTNTNAIDVQIAFIDGVGYADGYVRGKFGATMAQAYVVVYQQDGDNWIHIADDRVISNSISALVSCEFVPVLGATYKAEYTFMVSKSGSTETVVRDAYKTYEG